MPADTPSFSYSAEELFAELQSLCLTVRDRYDAIEAYSALNDILRHAVNQLTEFRYLRLTGLFARINHLLHQHSASEALSHSINDTRVRIRQVLRQRHTAQTNRLPSSGTCLADIAAVEDFIAFIYNVEVPQGRKPQTPLSTHKDKAEEPVDFGLGYLCLSWTATTITVLQDHPDAQPITIELQPHQQYITSLLHTDVRLNLIGLKPDGHVEHIILDPDLLFDVSSVAACIESYGDSPYTYLLNRLRPTETSQAIILGNLASALLDAEIHSDESSSSAPSQDDDNDANRQSGYDYADVVRTFFQQNALQLTVVQPDEDFHAEALRQRTNIHTALTEGLPHASRDFDRRLAIVEPSFFCECLGLQGRMDFLQLNYTMLLEQKSGKGAFPPPLNPDEPRLVEKHYVQMLLYMAILHYGFNRPNTNAFLLYSKYRQGLLGLGPSPTLLNRALKLRNQMAWLERHCTDVAMLRRILLGLTPERLNTAHDRSVLWERYTAPQISQVLNPIQSASPLEQAYFFRYLSFVTTEHLLAKLGNETKDDSGFASKWHDSLHDKLLAGSIYCGLQLQSPEATPVTHLSFTLPAGAYNSDTTNFRRGDIVVLYAYPSTEEPDIRRTMVFRSTITDISLTTVTVRLRSPQTTAEVFYHQRGTLWAIEHDYFESSTTSLFRGLHSMLSAPLRRRSLVLSQRQPEVDESLSLRGDYGTFNELMLRVRQSRDLFLIIGPPGTGKTSFGMLNTLREELLSPDASVLLLSYTNRAVDEICSKLIDEGIDFLRIGGRQSASPECHPYLLSERTKSCSNREEMEQLLLSTRVIAATTTSMNAHQELFRLRSFSLAIIDEASQILEPHLATLFSATTNGAESIRRFVLIGDHKQLPAVVQQSAEESAVTDPLLISIGLTDTRLSFFERMYTRHRHDPSICYMLTRQGRMHPDISAFPNKAFYAGRLQPVPLPHQEAEWADSAIAEHDNTDRMLNRHRVLFFDVNSAQDKDSAPSASPKTNHAEAQLIAQLVLKSWQRYSHTDDISCIGIIVPYRNQIATIRTCIDRLCISHNLLNAKGEPLLHDITIDTVERYQGSQRRVIIYGFTVSQRYQLNFLCSNTFEEDGQLIDRKLNVAMTRAMDQLLLVGNADLLSQAPVFRQMLQSVPVFTPQDSAC